MVCNTPYTWYVIHLIHGIGTIKFEKNKVKKKCTSFDKDPSELLT